MESLLVFILVFYGFRFVGILLSKMGGFLS